MGVPSNHNSNYILQQGRVSKDITSENTVLTIINSTNYYGHCFIQTDQMYFSYPLKIEFEIDSSNNNYFNIYDNDEEARVNLTSVGHYIIIISSNGLISATCNGNPVTINPQNTVTSLMRLSFFLSGFKTTLSFKNLMIYSIS